MKTFIISRTDAIGDVVLTLPMAGILKSNFPDCKVLFFGKTYTKPVVDLSRYIDGFINYDEFSKLSSSDKVTFLKNTEADEIIHVFPRKDISFAAKKAGIKIRTGTTHRWFHWLTCNHRINFSRKNSALHEAQLNCLLLKDTIPKTDYSKAELTSFYGFHCNYALPSIYKSVITEKINVLIHPLSHGHGREWGLDNYKSLIIKLNNSGCNCIVTGSAAEQKRLQEWIKELPEGVIDLTGKLQLDEFIALINESHGIVAGGTGPLHIAAALGRNTVGFFPPIKPIHAGRWAPLGINAHTLTFNKPNCVECKGYPEKCVCIKNISVDEAAGLILRWQK